MRARRGKKKTVKKKKTRGKRAKAPARKTSKKAGRKKAGKTAGKRGTKGRTAKKARSKTARKGRKSAPASALKRIQPELETALSRILGRMRRKLDRLPRSPQLKLLELEAGGYNYTLNRLRPPPSDNLTQRQKQIARHVSQGLSNKEIAEKLDISPATVAAHLRTIFTKLRVRTRTALAKHALAYYM